MKSGFQRSGSRLAALEIHVYDNAAYRALSERPNIQTDPLTGLFQDCRRLSFGANVPWGASVRQSTQCPMDRLSFFFSFELSYQRVPLKPPLGGAPEVGDQLPLKPLAVPALIVQNGRAFS